MKSMFTGALTVALIAGSLLAGTAALAGPRDFDDHGRVPRGDARRDFEHGHDDAGRRDYDRDRTWRAPPRWVAPERRWYGGPYAYGFRAPYAPRFWHRGEYLPVAYFGRDAWIPDYAFYRLRPPPPGCAWVQVGDDFVLTALATGLVVDVVHHLIG